MSNGKLISLEKKVDELIKGVYEMRIELFGNGKIGLFERIRNLEKMKKIPVYISWGLNFLYTSILIYLFIKGIR